MCAKEVCPDLLGFSSMVGSSSMAPWAPTRSQRWSAVTNTIRLVVLAPGLGRGDWGAVMACPRCAVTVARLLLECLRRSQAAHPT
jgi:hypothetical protein